MEDFWLGAGRVNTNHSRVRLLERHLAAGLGGGGFGGIPPRLSHSQEEDSNVVNQILHPHHSVVGTV